MRRLNLKFLVVLVVATCVVGLGVHLLHGFNVRSSSKVVLGKADDAREKGDLRTAVRYYGEYLRHVPDDLEARATQALIAADITKQKDVQARDVLLADNLLEEALRQDALRDRGDLRRKLIDVQIMRGRPDDARKNIERLTDPTKPDPELDYLYARCAYATSFFDKAVDRLAPLTGYVTGADGRTKVFDAKKATAPDNVDAYMLLALILRENKKQFLDADACVNAMVAANPKSAKALMQRSVFQIRYAQDGTREENERRLKEAREDLRKALAIEPDNVDALMQNADLDIKAKNFDPAIEHIRKAIKIAPKNERLYLGLASVLLVQQKPKDAIAAIEQGLKEAPKSPELIWGMHEIQWRMGNVDGLKESIEQMESMKFMPERLQLAKARVPLVEHKWGEAARQLEEVRPQLQLYANLAQSADLALGQCYANLRQPDLQLKVYNRILQGDPRHVEALRGKAQALTTLLRFEEALDVYQKGLANAVGKDEFLADRALVAGYLGVLTALSQRGDENAVHFKRIIERIRDRIKPESLGAVEQIIVKADEAVRAKKFDEALTILKEGIAAHPQELRLRISVVAAVAAQDGPDAALQKLTEVEKEVGASNQTRLLRGELLVRKGGANVKQTLAELEQGAAELKDAEQAEYWARLGGLYLRLGAPAREDALRCYRQALALRPENVQLLEGLFELARESGDHLAMLKARDDIEKGMGRESSLWKYAEAVRLAAQVRERGPQVEASSLNEAASLAGQLASQRPDWYLMFRLQGDISDLKGDHEEAIRNYQKALDSGPPNAQTVQRLVELQMNKSQFVDARKTLQRLGDNVPLGKLGILVEVLGKGNPEKALKDLEREVPADSTNPSELLWKGQLLLRLDQKEKAEAAFKRAAEHGPNLPQTWLALVEFLARFKNGAEAESVIRNAENQLSEDQATLVLAQCYALIGNYAQAESYYLKALRSGPATPALARTVAAFYLSSKQPDKAAPLLKSLVESSSKLRQEDQQHAAWARRELGMLLAQSQSQPQFEAAIRLIDANATASGISPQDGLLKARMYASRRDPQSLRQAEKLFDSNKDYLGYDDKLALAHVYANTNQWEKGRRLLVELNIDQPEDTRVMVALADGLLKRGDLDSAQSWIRKLEQVQKDSLQAVHLNAWLAMRRMRPGEAEDYVKASLPKEVTKDNIGRVVQGARILEEVKNYDGAEKLLRANLSVAPGVKGELTQFLARRGKAEECLALLKEQVSDQTIEAACILGTQVLREQKNASGQVPTAQRDLVLSWYEECRKRPQQSLALRMNEALLYDLLGRTQDAARVYRELLESKDLPDVARATTANNLAYLLAVNGGDNAEAQKLIDFATAQLGLAPEIQDSAAMVALAKGKAEEAVKILTEATEFGGSSEMFFHLALAYQKQDNRGKAGQWLRRAREEGLRKEALSQADSDKLAKLDSWLNS